MNLQNKSLALNVVLAIAVIALGMRLVSIEKQDGNTTIAAEDSTQATERQNDGETKANGFKPFNFTEEFKGNPFSFFMGSNGHGTLLCAGNKSKANAMTIGWGTLGTLWGKPVLTVYVRSDRYTHRFMEECPYFTVMKFSENKVVDYMGTHSGSDGNKASALGLHIAYTQHGAPYYKEADEVIECRTLFARPLQKDGYRDALPHDFYADPSTKGHVHTEYIGEIVGAIKK